MLTEETPATIPARLTIKAQGVENTLQLTYHNHDPDEWDKFTKNPENFKVPKPPKNKAAPKPPEDGVEAVIEANIAANVQLVLFLVKSFDDGTDKAFPLNYDGLFKLERKWPGTLHGIVRGYHQARTASIEKN